uniref:Fucosyltransferase n=1 Tax=Mesocestoides corti TaxID=53468 RepID=A0A5K3F022_MESCO
AVVYSDKFSPEEAQLLKQKGVLIVFESGESPFHVPFLDRAQLKLIDLFNTYLADSSVPYMYPMFFRNTKPKLKFTDEEKAAMLAKNKVYLLPSYHKERTKLIAWVVSNTQPKNIRAEFAAGISEFIIVDIYGRGGTEFPPELDAFQWLSENYKFYLAFENSNCRNYITEKATVNALKYVKLSSITRNPLTAIFFSIES